MFRRTLCKKSPSSFLMITLAVTSLAACVPVVDQRGNLPKPDNLTEIHPGTTTREQVAKLLGTPSSTGVFDDKTWYYISRKTKQVSFFEPEVLDQQVYIVDFDDQGVVRAVGHKDLADGRAIEPAPGATPAPGRELTFVEQVLGNVGRFNKGGSSGGGSGSGGSSTGVPEGGDQKTLEKQNP